MKQFDLMFKDNNKIFNFRSSGVLIKNKKVLIQRGVNDSEYALPGGQVSWGETSAEAILREYKEELGADIIVERLIWVEEVFWKWGSFDAHSICHYHLIHLTDISQIPSDGDFKSLDTDVSRLIFQWVNINELDKFKIYPEFLKDNVNCIGNGVSHFVTRE